MACHSKGALAVNPDNGTVYYQAKGSNKLLVCKVGEKCTDAAEIERDIIDMEFVDGSLWITDGKKLRSCSLSGSCPGTIKTQLDHPVGIVRGPSGVVYVLGASGRLAKCSSNAACEIVK